MHTISGDLYLEGDIVDDLSGFANLTTIGGDFTLINMTNTTSIASFTNVTSLGGDFQVDNLDLLTEVSILDQISSLAALTITNNALLNTITLNQLQTMTGSFRITFNSSLSSLSVPQLNQIEGELRVTNIGSGLTNLSFPLLVSSGNVWISDIAGVTTLDFLEYQTAYGVLSIGSCASLTTINLPELTSAGNDFSIKNSPLVSSIIVPVLSTVAIDAEFDDLAMTNLNFLQAVTSIGGRLSLTDMTVLSSLQGMNNLTSIGGLNLTHCDLVANLEGFSNLNITSLNSLNIWGNEGITSLNNSFIESLTSLGTLGISFNGNLIEIDALQNVTSLTATSSSTIRDNNALESINLFSLNNVTNTFTIQNQPNTTSLCGLYDYVTTGNGATTLSFFGTNAVEWDSVQDILDNCNTGLNANAYLQGAAVNPNTGEESLMRDDLRVNGIIPTTSPYSDGMTCNERLFVKEGADAIVDWIWLELRDSSDNTTIITSRSALLQRDGDIVHVDGNSPVYFNATTAGNYYVVVNHRNHLGIMTVSTITLSNTATTVNYTDANNQITFGTDAQTTFGMPSGIVAMWSGDANGDGQLNYLGAASDLPSIRSQVFNDPDNSVFGGPAVGTYPSEGYNDTDIDLDGKTVYSGSASDVLYVRDNIFNNPSNSVFGGPAIATYIFIQQLPEGAN